MADPSVNQVKQDVTAEVTKTETRVVAEAQKTSAKYWYAIPALILIAVVALIIGHL